MAWEVVTVEYFDSWLLDLGESEQQDVLTAILVLEQFGPALGRPYVDSPLCQYKRDTFPLII